MQIQKTVDYLNMKGGVPGQGVANIVSIEHGVATLHVIAFIRKRAATQSIIVTVDEELEIPVPDKNGVFEVKGQNVCLVRRARMEYPLDADGNPKELKHVNELVVDGLEEIYAEIISDGLRLACAPVRRGTGDFDFEVFETKLAAAFSSDEYGRNLPPNYNPSESIAWNNTVVFKDVLLNEKNPVPEGWERVFDLTTTPQSDKVCTVYTLAKGARIENKKLVPGTELFGEVSIAGVFAPACAPTQMYKPWSTARSYVKLETSEEPLVSHDQADNSLIQGRNLLTAIVHDKYNQMDQLTISETAAKKFLGHVYTAEVVAVTSGGSELLVHLGQTIEPDEVLATVLSIEGQSEIRARRLVRPAVVDEIVSVPRTTGTLKGIQHRIVLRSVAPMVSGDKLMPRSGCKGCVVVVKDEELPEIQMKDGTWRRVDLAVNPFPVAKRKNLSMLLEIACNEAGIKRIPINTNAMKLKELFEAGFGHKKPARKQGFNLANPIAAGMVYWMRSNSLKEYRTYGVSHVKKNFQELNPDRGRNSGVSYNPTARLILANDKECTTLDKILMERNFNPNVSQLCADLYMMIDTHAELVEE